MSDLPLEVNIIPVHPKLSLKLLAEASTSLPLPAVLTAPIRLDVVSQVHSERIPRLITFVALMYIF